MGAQTLSDSGWTKVRVDVPDTATFDRLIDSNLDVLDCTPHLGSADVAIGPGEELELIEGGYTYRVVSKLEDPRNWYKRHGHSTSYDGEDYRLHYFDADQILAFYEDLRANHHSYVSRINIGTSTNGETIWAYRFQDPRVSRTAIPNNIVIESLIHAREWISGACVMHIAKKVVEGLENPTGNRLLPNQVLWIIPIVNPDGFRYTWTDNRLWRKNRRNNGSGSYGVDLNRNFSKAWGGSGSSGNPNSETYRGPSAFSEPETQAIRNLLLSLQRVGGFIDYHSYSQLILWPWAYTLTAPPDAATLNNFGIQIKAQMDQFGATYTQGQAGPTLYLAAGSSKDYVYDGWTKPAFTIELRDTGQNGFLLPESEIFASQDEVWAGFKVFSGLAGR